MATTFNFEELDEATHDYLVAVRDAEGLGSPGVFVATSDSLPGCGCIMGPILIVVTLVLTLTTWILDVLYKDPINVAFLQTAGLLLGGWLLVAGFRASRGTNKVAGTWVYADPLYLYEAYREQVTVTPIDEVAEAHFTHNYNNGAYQNSVVNISTGNSVATITLNNEARAEQMVVYLNYLAWARGPDGGERANLPAATLGGLAKYVAKNDHEPLDAESNINLNLIELDITEVPEQPTRAGRAMPGIIPYVVMFGFAVVCFCVMAFVVNPPLRDDAIYNEVMKEPAQPTILRAYLIDPRNKKHRKEVTERLERFYTSSPGPIEHVQRHAANPELGKAMAKVLDSVKGAEQPVVSLRVAEKGTPAGKEGSKATREAEFRTQFVNGLTNEFKRQHWGEPIKAPPGMEFNSPPTPIGDQLLAFVEAPDDAKGVHFDITYTITAGEFGFYSIVADVEIRTNVDDANPTGQAKINVTGPIRAEDFDSQQGNPPVVVTRIRDDLVKAMCGLNVPAQP